MGKAHSVDLRDRVYAAIAEGGSRRAAARCFGVSAATAVHLAQHKAQTGSLAPARQGRPAGSGKLSAFRDIVMGWVDADGELTLSELTERLAAEHGVAAPPSSLSRLLREASFTVKKTLLASKPIALTSPARGGCGACTVSRGCADARSGWCSSMRPGRPPR